jgi:chemotaxis methyl-accepting protein methylase
MVRAMGGGDVIPGPERNEVEDELAWLGRILGALRDWRGVDFEGYRTGTVLRRVRNRMIAARAATLPEYLDRLVRNPAEADALLERLTIKVSRFFRDPATFEALRRLLAARRAADPARGLQLWSAGCGHGEEPYSLAMLLAAEGVHSSSQDVLATDVDPAALSTAMRARYEVAALQDVPAALRERFFEVDPAMGACRLRSAVRARVEFLRHDLVGSAGAPDGRRFDLVCCRNVLIYLEPTLQLRVERLLLESLSPGGLLCLGEAEWPIPEVAARLSVVDRRARIFELRDPVASGGHR